VKQLFGALCAAVIALSSLAAPAGAQMYRDHAGWKGAGQAPVVLAAVRPAGVRVANVGVGDRTAPTASRGWSRRSWSRRHMGYSRYYRPAARRSYRTYKQVWFGNKIVWWPVAGSRPVVRRARTYRYAAWHSTWRARQSRWAQGHRVYWHPGFWTNGVNVTPGTWTPEPVYRYNPNGQNPTIMNVPAPQRQTTRGTNNKTYPGYQYYYYGKPTSAAPSAAVAHRPTVRGRPAASMMPHDNIPTVYLYQNGHRQGIHLPPAAVPKPEPPAAAPGAPGVAPGTTVPPGAPAVPGAAPGAPGVLIPGVPAAPDLPIPAATP
jgi:hypothetical protein